MSSDTAIPELEDLVRKAVKESKGEHEVWLVFYRHRPEPVVRIGNRLSVGSDEEVYPAIRDYLTREGYRGDLELRVHVAGPKTSGGDKKGNFGSKIIGIGLPPPVPVPAAAPERAAARESNPAALAPQDPFKEIERSTETLKKYRRSIEGVCKKCDELKSECACPCAGGCGLTKSECKAGEPGACCEDCARTPCECRCEECRMLLKAADPDDECQCDRKVNPGELLETFLSSETGDRIVNTVVGFIADSGHRIRHGVEKPAPQSTTPARQEQPARPRVVRNAAGSGESGTG